MSLTCSGKLRRYNHGLKNLVFIDVHNLRTETIKQQYKLVNERTSSGNYYYGSHVMQYDSKYSECRCMLPKHGRLSKVNGDVCNKVVDANPVHDKALYRR